MSSSDKKKLTKLKKMLLIKNYRIQKIMLVFISPWMSAQCERAERERNERVILRVFLSRSHEKILHIFIF